MEKAVTCEYVDALLNRAIHRQEERSWGRLLYVFPVFGRDAMDVQAKHTRIFGFFFFYYG